MLRQRIAWVALLIGAGLLIYSFVPGYGPQQTWFQDSDMVLSDPGLTVTAVNWHPYGSPDAAGKALPFKASETDQTITVDLTGLTPKWYTIELVHKDSSEYKELQVLHKRLGAAAAAGALLTILAAPEVLIRKSRLVWLSGKRQVMATGWAYLLMEPGTGLSLARLQLIILFVPAAAVYLTLSFPLHQFPPMPNTVWQLLGLGGATAALSTVMTPNQKTSPDAGSTPTPSAPADKVAASLDPAPAAGAPSADSLADTLTAALKQQGAAAEVNSDALRTALADAIRQSVSAPKEADAQATALPETIVVRAPSTADLFEEANGYGDISRYQSLVMCVATAVTFFVSFFDTWSVPDLPTQVLELLGTSLAVYLGVKGINLVKKSNTTNAQ